MLTSCPLDFQLTPLEFSGLVRVFGRTQLLASSIPVHEQNVAQLVILDLQRRLTERQIAIWGRRARTQDRWRDRYRRRPGTSALLMAAKRYPFKGDYLLLMVLREVLSELLFMRRIGSDEHMLLVRLNELAGEARSGEKAAIEEPSGATMPAVSHSSTFMPAYP
jgi:hypothetical protein